MELRVRLYNEYLHMCRIPYGRIVWNTASAAGVLLGRAPEHDTRSRSGSEAEARGEESRGLFAQPSRRLTANGELTTRTAQHSTGLRAGCRVYSRVDVECLMRDRVRGTERGRGRSRTSAPDGGGRGSGAAAAAR